MKKKILKSLREEFEEFIRAFEIYLLEFVQKKKDINLLSQIKEIETDYVVSVNYTMTERLYGIDKEKVHHIHGMIRENINSGANKIVMGVNEQGRQNIDFIYFIKYFQRIQKKTGMEYKRVVDRYSKNKLEEDRIVREGYLLYIYGHSLDETDADIIKYLIGEINEKGKLDLKPEKVTIFYRDNTDYEQKVVNLIKLYGRSIVEENIENEHFTFVETDKSL